MSGPWPELLRAVAYAAQVSYIARCTTVLSVLTVLIIVSSTVIKRVEVIVVIVLAEWLFNSVLVPK